MHAQMCEPRRPSAGMFMGGEIPGEVGVWEGFLEEETYVTLERYIRSEGREGVYKQTGWGSGVELGRWLWD